MTPNRFRTRARALPRTGRLLVGATIVLAGLVLGACGNDSGGGSSDAAPVKGVTEVSTKDVKFAPAAIEVPAGTTVTWKFDDDTPHNVKGEGWGSGDAEDSGTFTHAFEQAGTYDYRCTLHSGMDGKVVVTG